MKRLAGLLLLAAVFGFGADGTSAHHSFSAVYDANKVVTVSGVVTRVEWLNPHAHFYANVERERGKLEEWDFELGSPDGLMRIGWTRNSLKAGDKITVKGYRARDGSNRLSVSSVTRADGKKIFTGDPVRGVLR